METFTDVRAAGWYDPPASGAAILVGQPADGYARLNYNSLRHESSWSRRDVLLADDSLVYAFASPFDWRSAMIGDIGVTLYRGTDEAIKRHLTACMDLTFKVAGYAEVGMELRELFEYADREIRCAGLVNETSGTRSGLSNIGHTVPWSYGQYSRRALECLRDGDTHGLRAEISGARVSIDNKAVLHIQPDMAFTVEPQISSPSMPLCSYHVIVSFVGGTKEIISCFGALLEEYDMETYVRLGS